MRCGSVQIGGCALLIEIVFITSGSQNAEKTISKTRGFSVYRTTDKSLEKLRKAVVSVPGVPNRRDQASRPFFTEYIEMLRN